MQVVNSLEEIPALASPIALSIGNFDGVHLGHQYIFNRLKQLGTSVVFTFSNHPDEVLHSPKPRLCTLEHKLHLFEIYGIDLVICIPFTKEFSTQTYEQFLKKLKTRLPFSFLIRGEGSTFGKDKGGDEAHVKALEKPLDFKAEYLKPFCFDGQPVSSGLIRQTLAKGDFQKMSHLLSRPYSIYGHPPFINLALPPQGKYPVRILSDHHVAHGFVIVGSSLELECDENVLGHVIEVRFE